MECVSSQTDRPARPPHSSAKPRGTALKQREAARRALAAEARTRAVRRRRLVTVLAPLAAVVAVVLALVAVRAGTSSNHSGKKSADASAVVVAQVTAVPIAALNAAGAGAGTQNEALTAGGGGALAADAKPRVLYVGAEYCPYCAAERWPLIVALSRFGTWSGLKYSYSGAAPEVFPDTATFTFHGARYTSPYLSFTGVETATNQEVNGRWQPLDELAAADAAIMRTDDPRGSVPFTSLAGRYVINGATYDPSLVHGKTHTQIAGLLSRPTSAAGRAIDGAANLITAGLCQATGGQPSSVCTSSGVIAAAKALPR